MATANQADKAKKKVKALRVVAKRDGFRRCGRRFGAEPTDVLLSDLKPRKPANKEAGTAAVPSELEVLTTDPMLVAFEVEIEVEGAESEAK